jgi:hypothetical protein
MAENMKTQSETKEGVPVLRTFALARICEISRWKEIDDGIGVCRITVVGEVPGPASSPPRITFYVKDGGFPEQGHRLRPDEARRCAAGLHVDDLVQLIGNVGPERVKAEWQEVIVTEQVKLKDPAPKDEGDDQVGSPVEADPATASGGTGDGRLVGAGVAA